MKTSEHTIAIIREQGHRITTSRRGIIEALFCTKHPVSASDIQAMLSQKNIAVNKTTVYRELDFLVKEGIVSEVHLRDTQKYYEIIHEHHHHIVCLQCHKVDDVVLHRELDEEERRIEMQIGYKVKRHSLEFFGICLKCQSV